MSSRVNKAFVVWYKRKAIKDEGRKRERSLLSRRKIKVSLFTESAHRDYNLFGTVSLNRHFFGNKKIKRENNTERLMRLTVESSLALSDWIDSRANGGYSLNLSFLSKIAFQMGLLKKKEKEKDTHKNRYYSVKFISLECCCLYGIITLRIDQRWTRILL